VFHAALAENRALAVYSYRDLRDVAYSLMHKFHASFDDILRERLLERCLDNDASWTREPNVICQRYETIIAKPAQAVKELAAHLKVTLSTSEVEELAKEYSFEANQERTNALRDRLTASGLDLSQRDNTLVWDDHTLLHWNHIRENRHGWRAQAVPEERKKLAKIAGNWLVERGYERDQLWAEPVDTVLLHLESTRSRLDDAAAELRAQILQFDKLRAEMSQVSESRAQLAAELEARRDQIAYLDKLGPTTLQLAQRWRQFASRHPRGCALVKPIARSLIRLMAG
jgi:hypothetical protein